MLLFLTIALPMLGGAAMGLMRFSSAKSRGIYVETIVPVSYTHLTLPTKLEV